MLIKNGHLLNPATNIDEKMDLRVEAGKITELGKNLTINNDEKVIDAEGLLVFPGLIDLHVHFRDPGQTHKEDIETGSKAAVRGGVTTVVTMPNTTPCADSPEIISYVNEKAKEVNLCHVLQTGTVTKGMAGKEVSPIEEMLEAGAPGISEDGKSVMDSQVYKEAMDIMAKTEKPIFAHCEDINLVNGGVMNLGAKSKSMGKGGISNAVENIITARDIMLAEQTGAKLHLCHCSTKEAVELIRDAKKKGINVSGEVCPHHFTLTEDDIVADDGNYKMNPPLRTKADVEALKQGLKDGIIEAISTDHAPHAAEEKAKGFAGPFGIVGIETSAALTYTELVLTKLLTPLQMAEKMSYNPSKILGRDDIGDLSVGKNADIMLFDPNDTYEIHAKDFAGKSKNMPYEGRKVSGRVVMTIVDGDIKYTYDRNML